MRLSVLTKGILFFVLIHLAAYKVWAQDTDLIERASHSLLSPAEKEKALHFEQFLTQMGYEPKEITARIVRDNRLGDVKEIAQLNKRYEVVEVSKELAALVLAKTMTQLPNDRIEQRITEVISRFLSFGIRGLPAELSAELMTIQDPLLKQKRTEEFLGQYLTMAMSELRTGLLADIASIFYSAAELEHLEKIQEPTYLGEKRVVDEVVSRLVLTAYADMQLNPVRLLGRAMALGFAREAMDQHRNELILRMRKAVEAKGQNLASFISEIQNDSKNKLVKLKTDDQIEVKKADLALGLPKEDESRSALGNLMRNIWHDLVYRWTSIGSKGKLIVKADKESTLRAVWVYSDGPNPEFTDLVGFAPQGVTKDLILESKGAKHSLKALATTENLSAQARQYLYYGASRAPIDARLMKTLDHNLAPVEMPPAMFKALMERVEKTPEFKNLLNQKAETIPLRNAEITDRWFQVKSLEEKEMREFLVDLGFEDLSAQIMDYYQKGNTYNRHTQAQQLRNAKSYDAINAARELAIQLMSEMQGRLEIKNGRLQLGKLVADLISQQPMNLVEKIPHEISQMPEGPAREKAFDQYVAGMTREAMDVHARVLTSNLMTAIYGDVKLKAFNEGRIEVAEAQAMSVKINRIYGLVAKVVERMYMDIQVGQTRYLGRALLALMARSSEVNAQEEILDTVRNEVLKSGYRIENFLGDTWQMDGEHGIEKVPISSMSYVLTRNINPESVTIPFGAVPQDLEKAKRMGLKGNPLAAAFVITPDSLKNGYSHVEEWRDKAFYEYAKDGFSHIGYVQLRKAKNSNIKMSWMVDNYPHIATDSDRDLPDAPHNAGGLRFVGIEQFFMTSHHSRLMVATPNPRKLFDFAQEQIKKNGIPQSGGKFFPFPTFKVELDAMGKPLVVDDAKAVPQDYTITTPQAVLNDLYSEKDPDRFVEKWNNLVAEGFRENIRKGLTFIWVTPYARYFYGAGYCSSTGVIVSGQTTGLNLEPAATNWNPIVRAVGKAYDMALKYKIDFITKNEKIKGIWQLTKIGIIAPSSLAAQSFVDDFTHVDAPVRNITKRTLNDYSMQVNERPLNFKILSKVINFNLASFFARMRLDRQEVRAVSIGIEHASEVAAGSMNVIEKEIKEEKEATRNRTEKESRKETIKINRVRCEGVMM